MTAGAQRWIRLVFVAGLAAWIAIAVTSWAGGAPLGDNEARYARAAQLALDGEPPRWSYLSRGMTAVAAPGVWAGGGERALRVVPVLLGVGFVLAAAAAARRMLGGPVAAWLAAVLAATSSVARRSTDLLTDLPAAALLLLGIALLLGELDREDGPRWRVALLGPLFAAAMYVRYGSCLPIAVISVVALGFGGRSALRRPAPLLAAAALFVALMIPHALEAHAVTGSPLGFLRAGRDALHVDYRGQGLVGFVADNPFRSYGLVTTPLLVLGLLSILRPRDRRAVALWLIAVGDLLAIGLTTVAESRYIFLAIALLLALGIDAVHRFLAARPPPLRRWLTAAASSAVLASWLAVALHALRFAELRRARWRTMLTAAEVVRRDAAGAPCRVVARHTNQLEWYSGCEAHLEVPPLGRELVYVVNDDFGDYQPSVTNLPGHPRTLLDRPGVLVLRLDP